MITEGSDWSEKQRRGSTAMAGGGDGAALVERAAAGVLRAPGLHGSTRNGAVKVPRGVKEDGNTPAEMNRGGGATHRCQCLVQFRPLHGPGSWVVSLGSFLAAR
jgi:hypothetical protein